MNNEIGNLLNQAESSYELGLLYYMKNDKEKSKKYYSDALKYYRKINAQEEIKEIEDRLRL